MSYVIGYHLSRGAAELLAVHAEDVHRERVRGLGRSHARLADQPTHARPAFGGCL